MMDDKTRALLGDRAAAERLTEAGVLIPCPFCGEKAAMLSSNKIGAWMHCSRCGLSGTVASTRYEARLAWNTRAAVIGEEDEG